MSQNTEKTQLESFRNLDIAGKVYYQPQTKQKTFHDSILNRKENGFRDFLYGGAAKGGKSHSLRWEAHRNCLQYSGIRGLLIRSSYPELERTHLSRLSKDLPTEIGSYNQQKHTFNYFNGSVLEFGYGERKSDFDQYLSAEYDFIFIDELTTIPFEFSYLLRSRLAGSRSDFIPFWACATNPGSVAHNDAKKYFITKSGLNEEDFPLYKPEQVCFIAATVYDNQILLDRDPAVLTRLQQLSKKDQQKFLYGNWDIFEGQFFDEFNSEFHVIKKENYLSYKELFEMNVLGGMDYGQDTFVYWLAKDHNGNIIVFDEFWEVKKTRAKKIENQLKFMWLRGLEKFRIKADTNMWIKDAFDVEYTGMAAEDYVQAGINIDKVSKASLDNRGYRINSNDAVRSALHWEDKNGIFIQPQLKIYERCHKLIETLPTLRTDEKDVEDIADGQYDHPYDAFKYAFMSLWKPKEKPKEVDLRKIPYPSQHRKPGEIKVHDRQLKF